MMTGNIGLSGSRLAVAGAKSDAKRLTSLNPSYSDSGLFGLYVSGSASSAPELVKLVTGELKGLTSISAASLQLAKQQLRVSIVSLLESRTFKLEDLGTQLLASGKYTSPAEAVAQIEKVSAEQLQQLARKILSTPVAVAASGNLASLPRYDQITSALKL